MKNIGIYVNTDKDYHDILKHLLDFCDNKSIPYVIEYSKSGKSVSKIDYSVIDTVFVLGGDGTILSVARDSAEYDVNIISFNIGRLGFLSSCESEEIYEKLLQYNEGNYFIEERMMLNARIVGDEGVLYEETAMNDVFVSKRGITRTVKVKLFIDDIPVNDITADGLLMSTPTGSTGYSLSAGGPIITPGVDAFLISPVCAHSLSARSMIVPDKAVITLKAESLSSDLYLTIDGQVHQSFNTDDVIEISVDKNVSRFVRFDRSYFYPRLKSKLIDWSS